MTAVTTNLPTCPTDAPQCAEVLTALVSSSLPLADLAASLGISVADLVDLSRSANFQSHLDTLHKLTQTRLRIHTAQARLTAIHALDAVTRSTDEPVARRHAATDLMRAAAPHTRATRPASSLQTFITSPKRKRGLRVLTGGQGRPSLARRAR